jgi:hypothetical protein
LICQIFNLTLSSWPVATPKKKDRSDFAGGPSLGGKTLGRDTGRRILPIIRDYG